jgi:hypothetical protein
MSSIPPMPKPRQIKEVIPSDYLVCSSAHISGLTEQVNEFIAKGYKLAGNLIITGGCKATGFMQPMFREERIIYEPYNNKSAEADYPDIPKDTKDMRTLHEVEHKYMKPIYMWGLCALISTGSYYWLIKYFVSQYQSELKGLNWVGISICTFVLLFMWVMFIVTWAKYLKETEKIKNN